MAGPIGGHCLNDFAQGSRGEFLNIGLLTARAYITSSRTLNTSTGEWTYDTYMPINDSSFDREEDYQSAGSNYIQMICTNKSAPGFDDAPTWSTVTDDPTEKIGRTQVGKPEKLTTLEFQAPSSANVDAMMEQHLTNGSIFALIYTYDDPNEDYIYKIIVKKCKISGTGGGGGDNNSASSSTYKFEPYGGTFEPVRYKQSRAASPTYTDLPVYTTPQSSSNSGGGTGT